MALQLVQQDFNVGATGVGLLAAADQAQANARKTNIESESDLRKLRADQHLGKVYGSSLVKKAYRNQAGELVPAGTFDPEAFLQNLDYDRVSPDQANEFLKQQAFRMEASKKQAEDRAQMTMSGVQNPDVGIMPSSGPGRTAVDMPKPSETARAANAQGVTQEAVQADTSGFLTPDMVTPQKGAWASQPTAQPSAPVSAPVPPAPATPGVPASSAEQSVMDLGQSNITVPRESEALQMADQAQAQRQSEPVYGTQFQHLKQDLGMFAPQALGTGSSDVDPKTFQWEPKDDGTSQFRAYKSTLDSKLNSMGLPNASAYLQQRYENTLLANAPVAPIRNAFPPTVQGNADFNKARVQYATELAQAKGKAQQAVLEAREALEKDAAERGTQHFTADANKMAHVTQNLAVEQVTAPGISGHLPNPVVRSQAADASSAAISMKHLVEKPPAPNSPEWLPFKLLLSKNLIKLYNLPVGEGMVNEVSGLINNGASTADAARHMADKGISAGVANLVAGYISSALGVNDISGARYLAKHGADFAREQYANYGKGKDFDKYYPEISAGGKGSWAKEPTSALFEPKAERRTPPKQAPGTKSAPIPYVSGMKRDPNKVYRLPSGLYYGDGRKAQ